jgi:hypothetical protein
MARSDLRIVPAAAAVLLVAAAAPAWAAAESNLYLRVGPGIHASITTAEIQLSCSGDASCRFDVPPDSTFEIVASGAAGHPLRWTGCSAQSDANRCRVDIEDDAVLVTVR